MRIAIMSQSIERRCRDESGGGPPHSKTLARRMTASTSAKRLGVRLPMHREHFSPGWTQAAQETGSRFAEKARWRRALRARTAGIMLTECLVYIAVFAILVGVGTAAFYLCWNHSKAVVSATDDIGAALRAGERWRADVRNATGKISVQQSATGELVQIPEREKTIVYRFESGEVRREIPDTQASEVALPHVNTSRMSMELRAGVTAWRWELDLVVRRPETQLPLLFTFEAAQTKS